MEKHSGFSDKYKVGSKKFNQAMKAFKKKGKCVENKCKKEKMKLCRKMRNSILSNSHWFLDLFSQQRRQKLTNLRFYEILKKCMKLMRFCRF